MYVRLALLSWVGIYRFEHPAMAFTPEEYELVPDTAYVCMQVIKYSNYKVSSGV